MTSTYQNDKSSNSITQIFKLDNQELSPLKLNDIVIDMRNEDRYVNLTKLCKAGNKRYKHWKENKKTEAFLQVLSSTVGIPTVDLLRSETGGNGERHTYGHPQVAINMAQWISPEFDVQVSKWIRKIEDSSLTTFDTEFKDFQITLSNGKNFMVSVRNDGYINATQLCKAGKKLFGHYKTLKQTEGYLQALEADIGIPISELINTNIGQNCQDTWVHRKVGYHLAQWISPHFAVQVSNILDNIFLTGKYELGKEKSNEELESIWKEKLENQLKLKDIEKQNEIDISWLTKYDMKRVFYIGFIGIIDGKPTYKFGWSDDFQERRNDHIRVYGRFDIVFVVECEKNIILEQNFKDDVTIKKVRFSSIFKKKNRTELLGLNNIITIEKVIDIAKKLKLDVDKTIDKEMKHRERMMELETRQKEIELEKIKIENETRQKEIELEILKLKQNQSNSEPIKEKEEEIEFEVVESSDSESDSESDSDSESESDTESESEDDEFNIDLDKLENPKKVDGLYQLNKSKKSIFDILLKNVERRIYTKKELQIMLRTFEIKISGSLDDLYERVKIYVCEVLSNKRKCETCNKYKAISNYIKNKKESSCCTDCTIKKENIYKHCPGCKLEVLKIEFSKDKSRADGYNSLCKVCDNKKSKIKHKKRTENKN